MTLAEAELQRPIREIENIFIPLADGCRLAARLWLPEDAESHPVPALLEYLPYRKRDFMRVRDEPMHRYFAGQGYAALRVDLRGSGDSDGILTDEYTPQEQRDALAVIDWISNQPWCSGKLGMTGISWGGFNSLQVAALAPPALGAIITLCASDDRYSDDAHYAGGCLLSENQKWGTALFAGNALPPDPQLVGERWREMWRERLENNHPFPALWLRHQQRDDYWKQGSVCEDYAAIRCPVYAIGGWADGYSNAVMRLLEGLEAPCKGLIGPWAHTFPHLGVPGPAIGYLQEAVRWWDYWLRGRDNGIMREPKLRVWMQQRAEPEPVPAERAGRWVAEGEWPSPRIRPRAWRLDGAAGLVEAPTVAHSRLDFSSPQSTGIGGGEWCEFGDVGEAPLDQRADDGKSLVFDGPVLGEDFEILGAPVLELDLAASHAQGFIAARLCEVTADGASARISYGLLNLTHRDGAAQPTSLIPGRRYRVSLRLNDVAHRCCAGNFLRIALSTAYWPMVWPAAEAITLTLHTGDSSLRLPCREGDPADAGLAPFAEPAAAAPISAQQALRPPRLVRTIERDLVDDAITCRLVSEGGDLHAGSVARIDEIDLDLGHSVERSLTIRDRDPLAARALMAERLLLRREDWQVQVEATTELTASVETFRLRATLRASLGDDLFFERNWDELIPREWV